MGATPRRRLQGVKDWRPRSGGRLRAVEVEAEREAAILLRVRASVLTRGGIAGCAFVIECVPEDRALKTEVLSQIEAAAPEAIVATNTSGLAVAGVLAARLCARPSAFSDCTSSRQLSGCRLLKS